MPNFDLKVSLSKAIHQFADLELSKAAISLLNVLGYSSDKRLVLSPNTKEQFSLSFDPQHKLDEKKSLYSSWQAIDLLFQLTDEEIKKGLGGQSGIFENKQVDNSIINSYLFFSLELSGEKYSRSDLAQVTREINKLFLMPVMVIFKHNGCITIGIVSRRLNKKDASRDVLEKVTLIKDIHISEPHHGQIDILSDLALENLARTRKITNFVDLQKAWEETLDISVLNKKFYKEIQSWYFWAVKNVTFPDGAGPDLEQRNQTSVIRMITRLIFVWFIKEKGLVPEELFDEAKLKDILVSNDLNSSVYYKAILQNLFFATLNTEMGEGRKFRSEYDSGRDGHYLIHNVYRYKKYFKDPEAALKLFSVVPFLNGGLFECLDKEVEEGGKREVVRIDGFSDRDDNPISIPGKLFFGSEHEEDLSEAYGDRNHTHDKVSGLLEIFKGYKFTIEENTPIEEEIALDPELLGKVFENLLAAYNPETGTTARKQTGSFYTPREIVNYMVDEAIIAYLDGKLTRDERNQERLRNLFAYNLDPNPFSPENTETLIKAIDEIKVLDPACGSGAFPMGVLHKLVFILTKLDPENVSWRALQRQKAINETDEAYKIGDQEERRQRLLDIEQAFENNSSDYGRKLYLIENCIYGVDIQPIAVQIAKLRFFISLVVNQVVNKEIPNFGIRPLPNLESKFVAANSLIPLEEPERINGLVQSFADHIVNEKRDELKKLRHQIFRDRTSKAKHEHRDQDKIVRFEISKLLEADWGALSAKDLADWDPYDQNSSSVFFDQEWMFGVRSGFDIIIGNPPYIRVDEISVNNKQRYKEIFETTTGKYDLYFLFFEKSTQLLSKNGTLVFITPNKYCAATSAETLRKIIYHKYSYQEIVSTSMIKVFEDAANYPVISIYSNAKRSEYYLIREAKTLIDLTESTVSSYKLPKNKFHLLPNYLIPINIRQNDFEITLRCLEKFGKVKDFLIISEGLRIPKKYEDKDGEFSIVKQFQFSKWSEIVDDTFISNSNLVEVSSENSERYKKIMQKKILIAEDALEISATYDISFHVPQGGVYFGNSLIKDQDLLPYLAVLNSRLLSYIYKVLYGGMHMGGGYLRYRSNFLHELPFPEITKPDLEKLSEIVKQVLEKKKNDIDADIFSEQKTINEIIYHYFCLTGQEIAVIEEKIL